MNETAIPPDIRPTGIDFDILTLIKAANLWVLQHWNRVLIALAIAAVLIILFRTIRGWAVRLCKRENADGRWYSVLGRTLARTSGVFIVLVSIQIVSNIADAPKVIDDLIYQIFVVATAFQAAIWTRELVLGAVEQHTGTGRASGDAINSALGIIRLLVTFAVFAIALIVVLDNLGVNITGLVAGLGVGGIAIGLAAQGIFADLFAALAIIFDRPFRRGDVIAYDTTIGTVEEIGLKSTRIRSGTGEERIIANKQLLDKEIQNITQRSYRRVSFTLAIAAYTPADRLRAIPAMLQDVIEQGGHNFFHAGFLNFAPSSHDFLVEFDSLSPDLAPFFKARHDIGIAIIERLAAEGIALAYPTQVAFTAAPDGAMIMPYPAVQPAERVNLKNGED